MPHHDCELPPTGWECTREAGHDGPCAALMVAGHDERVNTQTAPYPHALYDIIISAEYRPGWRFVLQHEDRGQGSEGLTLSIFSKGYDTYHPDRGETYRVVHYFPVPPAAFDRRAWERWLLDCLIEVETHECCEFLQVGGARPFAPNHGPGRNPYSVLEVGRVEDAETRYTGERKAGTQETAR